MTDIIPVSFALGTALVLGDLLFLDTFAGSASRRYAWRGLGRLVSTLVDDDDFGAHSCGGVQVAIACRKW